MYSDVIIPRHACARVTVLGFSWILTCEFSENLPFKRYSVKSQCVYELSHCELFSRTFCPLTTHRVYDACVCTCVCQLCTLCNVHDTAHTVVGTCCFRPMRNLMSASRAGI